MRAPGSGCACEGAVVVEAGAQRAEGGALLSKLLRRKRVGRQEGRWGSSDGQQTHQTGCSVEAFFGERQTNVLTGVWRQHWSRIRVDREHSERSEAGIYGEGHQTTATVVAGVTKRLRLGLGCAVHFLSKHFGAVDGWDPTGA